MAVLYGRAQDETEQRDHAGKHTTPINVLAGPSPKANQTRPAIITKPIKECIFIPQMREVLICQAVALQMADLGSFHLDLKISLSNGAASRVEDLDRLVRGEETGK